MSSKKGISSIQLGKQLGIPQKTAWFLNHRLRESFIQTNPKLLGNIVEIDETYVGGKNKNRHWDKKVKGSQGRSAKDKTPVVGLLQRDGNIRAFVVKDTEADTLHKLIHENISNDAVVITDSYKSYNGLDKKLKHVVVKHTGKEHYFVVDKQYHTQNIEGFWSQFKRGILGIYHNISKKHLQRYCEEFSLKYNTRGMTDSQRFNNTLENSKGKRLTYKSLRRQPVL